MRKKKVVQHGMQGVFVFVLLGLLALMSTLLVLFGAQMYRGTVTRAQKNNANRVLSSYVRSMIRAEDAEDSVRIEEYDDIVTVALHEYIEDKEYVTWLYGYEGGLYEQFTSADRPFLPQNGVRILPVNSFSPSLENGILVAEMEDELGENITVATAVRCSE